MGAASWLPTKRDTISCLSLICNQTCPYGGPGKVKRIKIGCEEASSTSVHFTQQTIDFKHIGKHRQTHQKSDYHKKW